MILSAAERRKRINDGIAALGVKLKPDAALLETLVYLTEFPTPIMGKFDPQFLELPEEVLITVMRHHQKYFSVEDAIRPARASVRCRDEYRVPTPKVSSAAATSACCAPASTMRASSGKPISASRSQIALKDLANVTFQAKLGSYLRKTERVVRSLVRRLGGDENAETAARLAKCDLTTELVKEFTELQGVVGGLYARAQGWPEEVAQAIYDHYKPESMDDAIPRNHAGRLVSLSDKLDTLIQCFGIGMAPTGSRDPFALRRAAQGVVRIIVEGPVQVPLAEIIGGDPHLTEFFIERVKFYFRDVRGFAYDEVNAAIAAGWSDLPDLAARLERLHALRPTPDFEPLAASFKRIKNILRQAEFSTGGFTSALLEPGPETELFDAIGKSAGQPIESVIGALRPKVDLFFDKVLVNAPDPAVRANRLAMLGGLLDQFQTFADFSEIVTNS